MRKHKLNPIPCVILLFVILGLTGLLSAKQTQTTPQEIDRTDPLKVASAVLTEIKAGNYDGLINLMSSERQEEYRSYSDKRRQQAIQLLERDKKKVSKVKQITELRKLNKYRGKECIVANIKKTEDEIFVIIISNENNSYYFEDTLSLITSVYDKLELIKTVK